MGRPNKDGSPSGVSARREAAWFADMVERGVLTVASAREGIDVPRGVRLRLHVFAIEGGCTARRLVFACLSYRADTLREFNLLVRDRGLEAAPVVH